MEWTGWRLRYGWETTTAGNGDQPPRAAEALVIYVDPETLKSGKALLHPALDEALRDYSRRDAFGAKPGETLVIPAMGFVPEAYVIFAGWSPSPWDSRSMRITAGGVGRAALQAKISALRWRIPSSLLTTGSNDRTEEAAAAASEGLLLGLYTRNTSAAGGRVLPEMDIVFESDAPGQDAAWNAGFGRGVRNADAVCYARELTSLPGNKLTPAAFAEEAVSLAEHYGLSCRIYDEREAAEAGMGGLLAVGSGSANPPRMIVLRYEGNPGSKDWTGLIGKGITFDTGGINTKDWKGMEEMISDMGGAAAVFGVMRGLAERKPKVNVVAVVPAAENMPSGSAFKQGDVITTYSGKTVEVLNTDAEGRIVLADGLTTAIREGALRLVDVATLTGAVMHALGDLTTGAIANDEPLMQQLLQASRRAGEYVWPLPSHPGYQKLLHSDVADLKNHGGPWAGAIAGGLFIGSFAEELPWLHLDIGGTAWMWSDRDLEPKGGTGVMVRTLLEWLTETSAGEN